MEGWRTEHIRYENIELNFDSMNYLTLTETSTIDTDGGSVVQVL